MKNVKDYFYFSKSEKRGVVFLSALIVALLILKYFISSFISIPKIDTTLVNKVLSQAKIDSTTTLAEQSEDKITNETENPTYKSNSEKKLFYFNPAKVTATELKQLGCSDKLIKTWLNFTSKGGFFKTKNDVKKIYGVSDVFFKKIEPFIVIENTNTKTENYKQNKNFDIVKTEKKIIIEINTADTLQLNYLPGIGSAFAERIIIYRTKLGGFIKKEQLKEVYGIDTVLYNKIENLITINEDRVQKISINNVQVSQLKQHPYFSYNIANAIIQYRDRHGKFLDINDLKKVIIINEIVFKKISPYIKL